MDVKTVKKSIALTEDLYSFAQKQAAELGKKRAESPNLSAYIRELLLRERDQMSAIPQTQAA